MPSPSIKAFASPMRYYQGPRILEKVSGRLLKSLGGKPFIFGGGRALEALEKHHFFKALRSEELNYVRELFGGECCDDEIERLCRMASDSSCDIIVGAGGGKALDTAKAVGVRLKAPIICIPTIASTDATTSSLSVVYTTEHEFKEYRFYNIAPTSVLVDTNVIVEAPARFLACGIGDAFSKKFEVEACYSSGGRNQIAEPVEGHSPIAALYLAKATQRVLKSWAREAMYSVKRGVVSTALEAVVEACILLSGLSFESGGLAAAHSIYDGLTLLEDEMKPPQYHGELVFFGTCVQLSLEGRPGTVIRNAFKFGYEIGLPISLRDIGLAEVSDEEIWMVSEKAVAEGETIHKMPMEITAEAVFNSIKTVDILGERFSRDFSREAY
jgi:glycerol dehydrogenase